MFNPQDPLHFPRLMATQHPDNAGVPFWSESAMILSSQEVDEMVHCFMDLGCDEYMWDWEGKFADEAMIERLLAKHFELFQKQHLGKDFRITLRIPNIWEEKTHKLSRAFMSVISGAETLKAMNLPSPPVFELILPMTKRAEQLLFIQKNFQKFAHLNQELFEGDSVGEGYIHMIPLFESLDDFVACGALLKDFIQGHLAHFGKNPPYLRPFVARSDPALNAGFLSAVLGVRIALREFYRVGEESGLSVHPIVGTGSLPFRGGVNPENLESALDLVEGAHTVTIQSAFRYDYPLEKVKEAMALIRKKLEHPPIVRMDQSEWDLLVSIAQKSAGFYQETIEAFAPHINAMANAVPSRRERIQHIGLFGYSREMGKVQLPRAIKFNAACYSMGVPPEFIGLGRSLEWIQAQGHWDFFMKHFPSLVHELKHAGKFLNRENLESLAEKEPFAQVILDDIRLAEEILGESFGPTKPHHFVHQKLSSIILLKQSMGLPVDHDVIEAALLRKSLG